MRRASESKRALRYSRPLRSHEIRNIVGAPLPILLSCARVARLAREGGLSHTHCWYLDSSSVNSISSMPSPVYQWRKAGDCVRVQRKG